MEQGTDEPINWDEPGSKAKFVFNTKDGTSSISLSLDLGSQKSGHVYEALFNNTSAQEGQGGVERQAEIALSKLEQARRSAQAQRLSQGDWQLSELLFNNGNYQISQALRNALKKDSTAYDQVYTSRRNANTGQAFSSSSRTNILNTNAPPMTKIESCFDHLAEKAVRLGLKDALESLQQQPIRVLTMCSGSESPFMALNLLQKSLQSLSPEHRTDFIFEHVGSVEIEPFKQAFIERNFAPPVLFRDVEDFVKHSEDPENPKKWPRTAYGTRQKPPSNVHIVIAGTSCVDNSRLNHLKKKLGESYVTLAGVGAYAKVYRPPLILLENVRHAPWQNVKEFWDERNYHFHTVLLDTKNFYIPQTRERGYSICVDREYFGENIEFDGLHDEWVNLLKWLQRRASSPYTDFLLSEDDPRLLSAKREIKKFDSQSQTWLESRKRHTRERAIECLGTAQPWSRRRGNNRCNLSDSSWQWWSVSQTARVLDLLDITMLSAASNENFDTRYKNLSVDVSQNVDRGGGARTGGVVGCITPSGLLFETKRGGPITGIELLALQGMQIERLDLTKSSLKNMQDLAGNAMTTTAIGAAIVSAIITLHKKWGRPNAQPFFAVLSEAAIVHDTPKVEVRRPVSYNDLVKEYALTEEEVSVFGRSNKTWDDIVAHARASQRLCNCEQDKVGNHINFCESCLYTSCEKCRRDRHDGYIDATRWFPPRESLAGFVDVLNRHLPPVVNFYNYEECHDLLSHVTPTQTSEINDLIQKSFEGHFRLSSVKPGRSWIATYESDNAILELRFTADSSALANATAQSEGSFSINTFLAPMWYLFSKCDPELPAGDDLRKLFQRPVARMRPDNEWNRGVWELWKGRSESIELLLEQSDSSKPAWESKLGLQGYLYPQLHVFSKLKVKVRTVAQQMHWDPAEQSYHSHSIEGEYKLLEHCPAPCGLLYSRSSSEEGKDPVFFFLRSDPLGRAADDRMIFARQRPESTPADGTETLAEIQQGYLPNTIVQEDSSKTLQCKFVDRWVRTNIKLDEDHQMRSATVAYANAAQPLDHDFSTILVAKLRLSEDGQGLLAHRPLLQLQLGEHALALDGLRWVLDQALEKSLFSQKWHRISENLTIPRNCLKCSPVRPKLQWRLTPSSGNSQTAKPKLVEDEYEAKNYEQELKKIPEPMAIYMHNLEDHCFLEFQLNLAPLAHRAVSMLSDSTSFPTLEWRIVPHSVLHPYPEFGNIPIRDHSSSSDLDSGLPNLFGTDRSLWASQKTTLQYMINMELRGHSWSEDILQERCIDATGWRLEVKATAKTHIRGGIIADEVGTGKTTTVLGLLKLDEDAKKIAKQTAGEGNESVRHTVSEATIILVPTDLIKQWEDEIEKCLGLPKVKHNEENFAEEKPFYITLNNVTQFKACSSTKIERAKIVLVSSRLFESPTYWEYHSLSAVAPSPPAKAGRAFEQWLTESLVNLESIVSNTQGYWAGWDDALAETATRKYKRLFGASGRAAKNRSRKDQTVSEKEKTQQASGKGKKTSASEGTKRKASSVNEDSRQATIKRPREISPRNESPTAALPIEEPSDDEEAFKETVAVFQKAANTFQGKFQDKIHPHPLHRYSFRRVVVDEFPDVDIRGLLAIQKLSAKSKWLLSGTPPVDSYDSINLMARLLGTKVADFAENPGLYGFNEDLPNCIRIRSAFEEAEEYRATISYANLSHLYERARAFSEVFIQRSHPSEVLKKRTHVVHEFKPTIPELMAYFDTKRLLDTEVCVFNRATKSKGGGNAGEIEDSTENDENENAEVGAEGHVAHGGDIGAGSQDENRKEGKRPSKPIDRPPRVLVGSQDFFETDQEGRVRRQLEESTGPTAGLVSCTSALRNSMPDIQQLMEDQTSLVIRTIQRILTDLQELWFCDSQAWEEKAKASFKGFIRNLDKLTLLEVDTDVALMLDQLVCYAYANPITPANPRADLHPTEIPANDKKEMQARSVAKELESDAHWFKREGTENQATEIDFRTSVLEELVMSLSKQLRYHRSLEAALRIVENRPLKPCSRCQHQIPVGAKVHISSTCGHIVKCPMCNSDPEESGTCPDPACVAYILDTWSADFFFGAVDTNSKAPVTLRSSRMNEAISIVQDVISGSQGKIKDHELILVFVQFESMKQHFLDACKAADINVADGTISKPFQVINQFQNYDEQTEKKNKKQQQARVLLLELLPDKIAGWNLHRANHAIFLAPFVPKASESVAAMMKQAVGRAHRFRQEREVKIYHLCARNTVEVELTNDIVRELEEWKN